MAQGDARELDREGDAAHWGDGERRGHSRHRSEDLGLPQEVGVRWGGPHGGCPWGDSGRAACVRPGGLGRAGRRCPRIRL